MPENLTPLERDAWQTARKVALQFYQRVAESALAGDSLPLDELADAYATGMLSAFQRVMLDASRATGQSLSEQTDSVQLNEAVTAALTAYGLDQLTGLWDRGDLSDQQRDDYLSAARAAARESAQSFERAVHRHVQAANETGLTGRQLADQIDSLAQSRADLTASTQLQQSQELASQIIAATLAMNTGAPVSKTWVSRLDAETCPACRQLHGQTLTLEGTYLRLDDAITDPADGTRFVNDYADLTTPPAHPHCRCHLEYQWGAPESEATK